MSIRSLSRFSSSSTALVLLGVLSLASACAPDRATTAPVASSAATSPPVNSATAVTAATVTAAEAPVTFGAADTQAGFYRTRIGDAEVTVLSDGTLPLDVSHGLALGARPGEIDRLLAASFQKSPIDASFNVFLVRLDGKTLLVDTGSSANMGPTAGKLPQSLAHAGARAEDVTDVFLTHVHPDHSGGLVVGGRRAFPNATVHVDQKDIDYWMDPDRAAKATGMQATFFAAARASLQPYIDAGKLKTFSGPTELVPGFRAEPASGHTPGHVMYTLESRDQKLVFWGDLVHIAAVQFDDPGVAVVFDVDPARAVETRKHALAEAADKGYLIAQNHVAFPGLGHVRHEGPGYRWVPSSYVNDAPAK